MVACQGALRYAVCLEVVLPQILYRTGENRPVFYLAKLLALMGFGAGDGIRTRDPWLGKPMLWPAELHPQYGKDSIRISVTNQTREREHLTG